MNLKEKIVFIGKHYGKVSRETITEATGMSMHTASSYASMLRRKGVPVAKYATRDKGNAVDAAVQELLNS